MAAALSAGRSSVAAGAEAAGPGGGEREVLLGTASGPLANVLLRPQVGALKCNVDVGRVLAAIWWAVHAWGQADAGMAGREGPHSHLSLQLATGKHHQCPFVQGFRGWLGLKSRRGEAVGAVQLAVHLSEMDGQPVFASMPDRYDWEAASAACLGCMDAACMTPNCNVNPEGLARSAAQELSAGGSLGMV